MNLEALEKIKEEIIKWKNRKFYTYQTKNFHSYNSPVSDGEYILKFTTSIKNFKCSNEPMDINKTSTIFLTTTMSENPISDNENADKIRLNQFLVDFDEEFNRFVEEKIDECQDNLIASEPLFFN